MDAAPKEIQSAGIIQSAEQPIQDLHRAVSGHLNQAGHSATSQSVNPDDKFPLEGIKEAIGDTTHVVGSSFEELVGGGSGTTHVRTTEGKVPTVIALKRRLLRQAA